MADRTFDPWAFSDGLASEYHGKIEDAHFEFNEDGDRVYLILDIQTDDPEIGEGGMVTEKYPVGDDQWDIVEKGFRVKHTKNDSKTFNKNSGIATLCKSAILHGIDLRSRGDGTPFDARIWTGIEADFRRYEFSLNIRGEGKVEYARMLFDNGPATENSNIGEGPETGAAAGNEKPAAKKAAPKTSAPAKAADDAADTTSTNGDNPWGISKVLAAKLKAVAKKHDTHEAFMEDAFASVDGVAGDDAAELAVADSSDDGLWATARA